MKPLAAPYSAKKAKAVAADYRDHCRPALPRASTDKRPGDVVVTSAGLMRVEADGKLVPAQSGGAGSGVGAAGTSG